MSDVATELRELAARIEAIARESRVCNIAWPQVQSLCDFLALRAHSVELSARVLSETPRAEAAGEDHASAL